MADYSCHYYLFMSFLSFHFCKLCAYLIIWNCFIGEESWIGVIWELLKENHQNTPTISPSLHENLFKREKNTFLCTAIMFETRRSLWWNKEGGRGSICSWLPQYNLSCSFYNLTYFRTSKKARVGNRELWIIIVYIIIESIWNQGKYVLWKGNFKTKA